MKAKISLLLLIILFVIALSPLTVVPQRFIAVYEDDRDFEPRWEVFDVREARLYEGPGESYTLEVVLFKPLEPETYMAIDMYVEVDFDSNEATHGAGYLSGTDYLIYVRYELDRSSWPKTSYNYIVYGPSALLERRQGYVV